MSEQHRLDDETRRLGLEQLRELRQRLGVPRSERHDPVQDVSCAPLGESAEPGPPGAEARPGEIFTDPSVMAALMTAAAERERLESRVRELEAEVARLQGAMGEILRAAGDVFVRPVQDLR